MAPKREKEAIPVVELDSDDDNGAGVGAPNQNNNASSTGAPPQATPQPQQQPLAPNCQTLDSRSFWKAGDYAVGPTARPYIAQGQLEHARVHPKFLHSNALRINGLLALIQSIFFLLICFLFAAIAELLDNAVDEVQNGATFVRVDKIDVVKDNSPALLFQDDGGGMDPEGMRKCMSLGYSTKKANTTIGQYGNGFKTSTMRLGADVIVFSRAIRAGKATQSVGLLSYTFLRRTGQDDVIVPMIDFDISGNWVEPITYGSQDDWTSNLKTILEWSPFASKEDLMLQFEEIGAHGTRIVIYNLWLNDEGIYELSFDDDDEDIRLRDEAAGGKSTKIQQKIQSHISYRMRYSLRAYASILYLRTFTNFKIVLRGKPIQQHYIKDDLKYLEVKTYRPQITTLNEVIVETTIGFIKEAPDLGVSGFNLYHKNRLIRPFWKVTADGSSKGNGVVGILEANFIEPAHDKQDFERSSLFFRLETRLKQMVNEYWKTNCHFVGYQPIGVRNLQKDQTFKPSVGVTPKDMHLDQTMAGLSDNVLQNDSRTKSSEVVMSSDNREPMSVDEICEENIQLFMRCEAQVQKETELRQMIENLEKELEMAKRKSAQLASYLETKRKQKIMKQPTGTV
ncbi:protein MICRORCHIDIA 2-like [Prunus yedoensis var. nudiflora]|uniref:Protein MICRORCHIDIA 2-like n=1 Tax=Prunus yedoensis var. nudiflora TaxID=2094558 RepID=A0A314UJZ2_PRUYE|nr:protein MICRORCHIDIA 2-like [Prunus yedoensis var. nudiflora]